MKRLGLIAACALAGSILHADTMRIDVVIMNDAGTVTQRVTSIDYTVAQTLAVRQTANDRFPQAAAPERIARLVRAAIRNAVQRFQAIAHRAAARQAELDSQNAATQLP